MDLSLMHASTLQSAVPILLLAILTTAQFKTTARVLKKMLWVCAVVIAKLTKMKTAFAMISRNALVCLILAAYAMDQERPTTVDVQTSRKETVTVMATNSTRWAFVVGNVRLTSTQTAFVMMPKSMVVHINLPKTMTLWQRTTMAAAFWIDPGDSDCELVYDGNADGSVGAGDLLGLLTEFGSVIVDGDSDGVCDEIDDCVGEYDECGVCNGLGAVFDCGCDNCSQFFECGDPVGYQGYDYSTVLIGEQCCRKTLEMRNTPTVTRSMWV